eukprot:UC1_evm2s1875
MARGDMCLKIMECGVPKDVVIREGEMFLLPSRIPHSPQRKENTVGLVIERERLEEESDGLRYYRDEPLETEVLWEKWFHCYDLGKQLGPVITEYFASEPHKTRQPDPAYVAENPPVELDTRTKVAPPFQLALWLSQHADKLRNKAEGSSSSAQAIFSSTEFQVYAIGAGFDNTAAIGSVLPASASCEQAWLWQFSGQATIRSGDVQQQQELVKGDSILFDTRAQADSTLWSATTTTTTTAAGGGGGGGHVEEDSIALIIGIVPRKGR